MIEKVISGGQSGVDRAALDAAIALNFPYGGAIPEGRKAEDGPLDLKYNMQVLDDESYNTRTKANVNDSDATLILIFNDLSGGSLMTQEFALSLHKPHLVISLNKKDEENIAYILEWLEKYYVKVLNIAGPRASKEPLLYEAANAFVKELLLKNM